MPVLVSSSGMYSSSFTDELSDDYRRQVVSSDQTAGGFEWGYALPGEPTGANDEYIGYIV
jgi:hypothetical protein